MAKSPAGNRLAVSLRFASGPRVDVDLLAMTTLQIDTPDLVIPHPRIAEQAFVLVPLAKDCAAGSGAATPNSYSCGVGRSVWDNTAGSASSGILIVLKRMEQKSRTSGMEILC